MQLSPSFKGVPLPDPGPDDNTVDEGGNGEEDKQEPTQPSAGDNEIPDHGSMRKGKSMDSGAGKPAHEAAIPMLIGTQILFISWQILFSWA